MENIKDDSKRNIVKTTSKKSRKNKYKDVLTPDYLLKTENLSMNEQISALRELGFTGRDCDLRWNINKYRSKFNEEGIKSLNSKENNSDMPSGTIIDKKVTRKYSWSDVDTYYSNLRKSKERIAKQTTVNFHVKSKDKYLGVVLIGDYHLGSDALDYNRLKHENDLMKKNKHHLIAVQIGDVLNNEGSLTHRGSNKRTAPKEMSLSAQREFAVMVFNELKDVLTAFILGNHDERLLVSSDYDFGEHLVEKISGAYLGFSGDLFIHFDDLVYKIHLTHKGKGYSQINETHSGMRVARENHSYDVVVFGHMHSGVAYLDQPMGGNFYGRAIAIRSGGYKLRSLYGEIGNYIQYEMNTPMLILHPKKKYINIHRDMEEGIKVLNALNS